MDASTVEQVERWQDRSVTDGFSGLHDLADRSFSGAVRGSGSWLFMLNGRVIGVFDGRLDDLAEGSATAYEAPDPAVALLLAMQEIGGETRGRYYTEETPLSEVDDTLSGGKFTGYVELSENVLSGDYYVLYSSGRSTAAAYVGASERLITGDEAFEAINDEVGIYEVVDVDLDVVEIPEPEPEPEPADDGPAAAAGAVPDDDPEPEPGPADGAADGPDARTTAAAEAEQVDPAAAETEADQDASTAASDDGVVSEAEPSTAEDPTADSSETPNGTATDDRAGPGTPSVDAGAASTGSTVERPAGDAEDGGAASAGADAGVPESDGTEAAGAGTAEAEARPDDDVFSEEEQWRETRSIPALDPDATEPGAEQARERQAETGGNQQRRSAQESVGSEASPQGLRETAATRERQVSVLQERLAEVEAERQSLAADNEALASERDDLVAERDRLRAALEETQSELASVREELAAAQEDAAGAGGQPASGASGSAGGKQLSAAAAREGTNLFVRYESKGDPTLAAARDQGADRETVDANLRLEHHTQFDAESATVDGQPYREFLGDTLEYRFVDWVVRDLLYEIRDSGHQGGLADLYAAIPEIDRAQFDGTVTVQPEDGDDEPTERSFDVVLRDKMGRPLVVVDLRTGRSPVTGEMMESLVDDATAVAEGIEHLGAAIYVTASFFRPDALETAAAATGGGFLSRDKRESFVRVARKQGYHLCLVEARAGSFHVSIPEL